MIRIKWFLSYGQEFLTPGFSRNRKKGQKWGCCGMQGWRTSMEDAHIHVVIKLFKIIQFFGFVMLIYPSGIFE